MLKEDFCPPETIACGKEFKRQAISSGKVDGTAYEIAMYVGDLLMDFPLVEQGLAPFEKSSVTATRDLFGKEYIIIPNTVNPSWMKYAYSKAAGKEFSELSMKEQAELRRKLVRDWEDKYSYKQAVIIEKN